MTPRTLGLTDPLDQYLMQVGFREHEELKLVREETAQLPSVHTLLAPEQAQFMALLARLLGVRRYLESGTYTAIARLRLRLPWSPTVGSSLAIPTRRSPRPCSAIGVAQVSPTRSSFGSDRRSRRSMPCSRRRDWDALIWHSSTPTRKTYWLIMSVATVWSALAD